MINRIAPAVASVALALASLQANTASAAPATFAGKPAPAEAQHRLIEGNDRFRTGLSAHPHTGMARLSQAGAESEADHAFATILTCSDSRVPVERLFDAGVMDLYVVRALGAVAGPDEVGTIEYGLTQVRTPLLVVLGHTDCGAVTAAARAGADLPQNASSIIDHIRPAVGRAVAEGDHDLATRAAVENVWQSVEDLFRKSPATRELVESGQVAVLGAIYDVGAGAVTWLPEERPLDIVAAVAESPAPPPSPAETAGVQKNAPAELAPKAAATTETNAAHADDASLAAIASSGAFTKPNLVPIERSAFGMNVGAPDDAKLAGAEIPTSVIHQIFWLAVVVMIALTALLAWKLAHLRRADGTTVRGMTIGAKLAIPIGAMATLLVIVSAVSVTAKVRSNETAAQLSQMGDKLALVGSLKQEVLGAELAIQDFVNSESDDALARYSDYAATARARVELLKTKLDDQQNLALIDKIDEHLAELDKLTAAAVAAVDRERAVVDSLLIPTGDRATDILAALIETYRGAGDYQLAFKAAVALEHFALARTATQRFLRTSDPDQSKLAQHELELADQYLSSLAAAGTSAAQRDAIAEAAGAFDFYAAEVADLIDILQRRDQIVRVDMAALTDTIEAEGTQLVEHVTARSYALQSEIEAENAASTAKIAAFSVIAVIFGSVISVLVIRTLLKTIHSVLTVLRAVAAGDLTTTDQLNLKPKDEIGEIARATDAMATSLNNLLREVQQSAESLAAASEEIASSAEEMAGGMDNQTRQVTDIAAAIEQMSAAINEVADNSRRASGSADQSGEAAENGGRVVQDTIAGMQAINEAVEASSQAVQELGRRGEQIGEIIEVINDIADQTNLLALNAAIEAARAGEHGRGFAVVADEVRKLADRTTKATDEIADSIEAIQTETSQAVQRMQAGAQQVEQGVETAGKAGQALSRIVESAREVSSLIQNVAAATDEQSSASTQISQSIESIRAIASEATEGANQASIASSDLSAKAQDMQALVQRFKLRRDAPRQTAAAAQEKSSKPANA